MKNVKAFDFDDKDYVGEPEGSLKVSPTHNIGDTEIIRINCKTCGVLLWRMQHKLGDGLLLKHDVQSFKFKAHCNECWISLTKPFRDDLEE